MPDFDVDAVSRATGAQFTLKEGTGITLTADGDDVVVSSTVIAPSTQQLNSPNTYYWSKKDSTPYATSPTTSHVEWDWYTRYPAENVLTIVPGDTYGTAPAYLGFGWQDGYTVASGGEGWWMASVTITFSAASAGRVTIGGPSDDPPFSTGPPNDLIYGPGWAQQVVEFEFDAAQHTVSAMFQFHTKVGNGNGLPVNVFFAATAADITIIRAQLMMQRIGNGVSL